MVILTMTIERLSFPGKSADRPSDESRHRHPIFATFWLSDDDREGGAGYFVFTFPAILLILVGLMLAMGRYRGYRLTELFRFKAFWRKDC